MIDYCPSMRAEDNFIGSQKSDLVEIKDFGSHLFINYSLFISECDVKIKLASNVIDNAEVVSFFIENDTYIRDYAYVTKSKTIIDGLSILANEPLYLLEKKPFLPSKPFLTDCDNSYEIRFRNCDDITAGEVYDRLIHAISDICQYVEANRVLANIKIMIQNLNPMFASAKIDRLLEYKVPALQKKLVNDLSDLCGLDYWSVNITDAIRIFDSINKQTKKLVVPSEAIEELTEDMTERAKYIFESRGLKKQKSLDELATELNITRQRVHQIVQKTKNLTCKSRRQTNLINDLFYSLQVLCECDCCFTLSELSKFDVGENALIFLSEMRRGSFIMAHVPETDCIAICASDGKCEWLEHITEMTQLVPSLLSAEDQQNIIKELAFLIRTLGYNVPDNIIKKIAFRNYIKSGTNLVKKSLSMGDRYEIVLEKIFPEGIRVYNGEDMRLFRKGYSDLFNDNRISKNDHAIAARVIDRCILIDRGTYILNKRIEFPEELSKRIFDYIMKYPFDMVMTNAIMNRFNEELTAIEVNNKYCLVSVLKQHFSDNFCFRRDYVIKGEYTGNIYGNITSYVESHHDGVSIYDINVGFEGIPDAVIYFALSEDDSIIPMYNKMYIHKSNISFPEQLQVLAFLQKTINHEHIISDERVYVTIKKNFPNFIANNNINTSWFLFSILRSFFSYEFKFSRPHIIDSTFDSANGREALRESFWGKKYVDIADIKNYAKEKQIQIYDWSKLLDSYNDKYFIYDKERLIRIDESGYKPEDFVCIEKIILEALGALEYCEISKLNMLNSLPKLKVELTDWIIYSIINKYGTKISAITSTPQFLNSVPIVFRNSIGIETIRDYYASSDTADQTVKIDDLTDVDSLVEGLIDPDSVLFEGEV